MPVMEEKIPPIGGPTKTKTLVDACNECPRKGCPYKPSPNVGRKRKVVWKSLADLIKKSGLSYEDIGSHLGVGARSVGYWVLTETLPNLPRFAALVEMFAIDESVTLVGISYQEVEQYLLSDRPPHSRRQERLLRASNANKSN